MRYTLKMASDGTDAVRRLSEKAARYYYETEPFTIFAYENEDGEMRYSYSHEVTLHPPVEGLTFEELQKDLEEMQAESEKLLEEYGELEDYLKPNTAPTPLAIEGQKYRQKIEYTAKQLTEKEKELLSLFHPFGNEKFGFIQDPGVRAVKEKYGLSWSQIKKIAFRLFFESREAESPEKGKSNNGGKNMIKDNRYYNFIDAVKAAEEILGDEGRLEDNAGGIWDCYNLMIQGSDRREEGGSAYWCVGYDGSIGYTETDGVNVDWILQVYEPEKIEPEKIPDPDESLTKDFVKQEHMNAPVILYDAQTARSLGENGLNDFKSSLRENRACAEAIIAAKNENTTYGDIAGVCYFDAAKTVDDVMKKGFPAERLGYVIASQVVRNQNYFDNPQFIDGRFSRKVKEWAINTFSQYENFPFRNFEDCDITSEIHHTLVNYLAEKFIDKQIEISGQKTEPAKQTALFTVIQGGMTKHYDMGEKSLDDILRQFKKEAKPFVKMEGGTAIHDEGRFAELEQSGKVSVSVTADIDNDQLTVYEINGVPENERTDQNTRIWSRQKMANFLKDRVREPKDGESGSPFRGVGRSHASEHELTM